MNKEELMTLPVQGTLHCSCIEHCFLFKKSLGWGWGMGGREGATLVGGRRQRSGFCGQVWVGGWAGADGWDGWVSEGGYWAGVGWGGYGYGRVLGWCWVWAGVGVGFSVGVVGRDLTGRNLDCAWARVGVRVLDWGGGLGGECSGVGRRGGEWGIAGAVVLAGWRMWREGGHHREA